MDKEAMDKIDDLKKVVNDFIKVSQEKKGTDYELIRNDIGYIKKEVSEIKELISNEYVTKTEFKPIKNIVYGLVGAILLSVVAGLMTLIIKK